MIFVDNSILKQNNQTSFLCLGLVLTIIPALLLYSSASYFPLDNANNGLLVYAQEDQVTVPVEMEDAQQNMRQQRMEEQNDNNIKSSSLPQPNDDDESLLNIQDSNALFEPAAGLSNVFGPEGLFPFDDFNCADDLTCGVSVGDNDEFKGTFDKGNNNRITNYEATYTSPVIYGSHQIAGQKYKITLTDLLWNSSDASLPTKQPRSATSINNVGFNQIQHGASNIDMSYVPQLLNEAFLYGHA